MAQAAKTDPGIGFYTVEYSERAGWIGGYLVLNRGGRPLEFHCTLPVQPSRAHEILYGPALRAHLIGEAIGPVLLARARVRPILICCDQPEALKIEATNDLPIGLVGEAAESEEGPITRESLPDYCDVQLAGATLYVPLEHESRAQAAAETFEDLPDLLEPFSRIREAIQEAQQKGARPAAVA